MGIIHVRLVRHRWRIMSIASWSLSKILWQVLSSASIQYSAVLALSRSKEGLRIHDVAQEFLGLSGFTSSVVGKNIADQRKNT